MYYCLLENLGWLLCIHVPPLWGAAEITVKSWQLVTAIHDAGDGLIVWGDTD
jgi:hypothetical protein